MSGAILPSQSPGHWPLQSKGHQQLGPGQKKFGLMIGGRLWQGFPPFTNHYYIWGAAYHPVPVNHQVAGGEPSFIGPLYGHFDGSATNISGLPGFNDTNEIDLDDDKQIAKRTEVSVLPPFDPVTEVDTYPPANLGATENISPSDFTFGPLGGGTGPFEANSETHFDYTAGDGSGTHRVGTLGAAKDLASVQAEEWALAQTINPGYGNGGIVVKNTSGGNIGHLKIGLVPLSISVKAYQIFVAWNGGGSVIAAGNPGQVLSSIGPISDGAFWGDEPDPTTYVPGNLTGGYIVSYSTRAKGWNVAFAPDPNAWYADVPFVMGCRLRNISGAALATYEDRPGVGIVKASCVDVNYGGAEVLIPPVYTDGKAYSRWQVIFPGRKASEIGDPNHRWS